MTRRALILGSASPRRADLLRMLGLRFAIRPAHVAEIPLPGESPAATARRLAREKALALARPDHPALILAADTVVTLDGTTLGKPVDPADARRMLQRLAGRTHEVITALAVRAVPEEELAVEAAVSRVRFAAMSDEEIAWYAGTGEGIDKAGAYALQGIGALFVSSIEGSYTNVIGLPLEMLYPHLRRWGFLHPAPAAR